MVCWIVGSWILGIFGLRCGLDCDKTINVTQFRKENSAQRIAFAVVKRHTASLKSKKNGEEIEVEG